MESNPVEENIDILDDDNHIEVWRDEDNRYHRDGDDPALIYSNGTKFYYKHGDLHRDGDKPAIEWNNGDVEYYKNNELHRIAGPAIDCLYGHKAWYYKGRLCYCDSQEAFQEILDREAFEETFFESIKMNKII